jgi:hypothetical protein
MKPLIIALNGMGREWQGRDGGGGLTNVHCKVIQSVHSHSLHYNEYMVIKMRNIKKILSPSCYSLRKTVINLWLKGLSKNAVN